MGSYNVSYRARYSSAPQSTSPLIFHQVVLAFHHSGGPRLQITACAGQPLVYATSSAFFKKISPCKVSRLGLQRRVCAVVYQAWRGDFELLIALQCPHRSSGSYMQPKRGRVSTSQLSTLCMGGRNRSDSRRGCRAGVNDWVSCTMCYNRDGFNEPISQSPAMVGLFSLLLAGYNFWNPQQLFASLRCFTLYVALPL